MELKRPGFIPFTEKQWMEFKERMMTIIPREALSSEEILRDPEASQFVRNYADANFCDPIQVEKFKQIGITFKFANMDIDVGKDSPISYPIVNEYKGHHIYRTGYFARDGKSFVMKYIDVVPERKIIVPQV